MKRKPFIVANWKMHHSIAATRTWCGGLKEAIDDTEGVVDRDARELAVAPPFTSLATLRRESRSLPFALAAQNCHWETSGAFTGEVSPAMLAEIGCRYVIVGHSERRQLFGETDRGVARKASAIREARLVPILCVGESENQRMSNRTEPVIEAQLRQGLAEVDCDGGAGIVVAYEPVWAIGTGKVATPALAEEAHRFLRQVLESCVDRPTAEATRILYGGSVKPENAGELGGCADIDGFLVGGASLDPKRFLEIALAI